MYREELGTVKDVKIKLYVKEICTVKLHFHLLYMKKSPMNLINLKQVASSGIPENSVPEYAMPFCGIMTTIIACKCKLRNEDNIALETEVHAHACSTSPIIVNICFCAVGSSLQLAIEYTIAVLCIGASIDCIKTYQITHGL